jgi:hypothetical protein
MSVRQPRARSPVLALVAALAAAPAIGCGRHAVDVPALVARCGLDCAADELRLRLASSPRDHRLYVQLAAVEEQRGRPAAALAAYERAAALGRPFRAGLAAGDRARLAGLLTRRARERAARGSPGADDDVARLRALAADVDPALAIDAARAAIAVELRHTDPDRRRAATLRLAVIDPALAVALTGAADADQTERAARWLDAAGARRTLHEMLDAYEQRAGVAGFAAMARPGWALDRWLAGRRWWHGDDGRPDRVTLASAIEAGADGCAFPRDDEARRACAATTLAAPTGAAAAPLVSAPPWTELAVDVALAQPPAPAVDRARLLAIARGFAVDPALADRAVDELLATSLDVAVAAPAAARLLLALGDPGRARPLWRRAVDADPRDPALLAGLALAAADAGDADAALTLAVDAAAASGDGGGTMLRLARGLAVSGPPVAALGLARWSFELAPPGEDGPPAALAAALLDELGRSGDATALRARARTPSAWDLTDERAAIAGWRALAGEPATRAAGLAGLARLAADADPARQRLALAALRDLVQ